MPGPNFSESQLQSAVNSALVRYAYEERKVWILPFVVSLWDEFAVGWDSAFLVPWYPAGDPSQKGCNLFIQYKLSDLLTTPQAKHWSHWNKKYFRFKIPHRTTRNGKIIDDYHQWESLKKIANAGYATFYVTNNTLSSRTLGNQYTSGVLLDRAIWLKVSDITQKHKEVTFTRSSPNCYLHSEMEEVALANFREWMSELGKSDRGELLTESNTRLIQTLRKLPIKDPAYQEAIARIGTLASDLRERGASGYVHVLLRSFIHRFLGCNMHWIPVA